MSIDEPLAESDSVRAATCDHPGVPRGSRGRRGIDESRKPGALEVPDDQRERRRKAQGRGSEEQAFELGREDSLDSQTQTDTE